MSPLRAETWLVDFGEPIGHEPSGRRPAVVVSADMFNEGPANVVIVVPVTTTYRELATQIEIDADSSGLNEISYARCEDVTSVSEELLIMRLGRVGPDVMHQITRVLTYLLDL